MSTSHVRREFLRIGGGGALAIAALGFPSLPALARVDGSGRSVGAGTPLLDLALAVKHLEVRFYGAVVGGTAERGGAGDGRGVRAITFSDPTLARYAREIAADKREHLAVLRTLRPHAPEPVVDLSARAEAPFSTIARAAGLVGPGEAFDPYADDRRFLLAAFMLERACATAYGCMRTRGGEALAPLVADAGYHLGLVGSALHARAVVDPGVRTAAARVAGVFDGTVGTAASLARTEARLDALEGFFPAGLAGRAAENRSQT